MSAVTKDHFAFFSLPRRFGIDQAALGDAYRRVQSAVHPDRHAAAGDVERRIAMQLATKANEAFRTLADPATRARYLCELAGIDVAAESNTHMPVAFLQQQMAWREALDECTDDPSGKERAALAAEVKARREATLQAIGRTLDEEGDVVGAAALVRELMFVDRFAAELRERPATPAR